MSEADKLNEQLTPEILSLLSEKGKGIFFPKSGILAQSAEAKGKRINATIGIALEDDGTPMRLGCVARHVDISPGDAFAYASSYGKQELRERWQRMIKQKNPKAGEISLPVVTNALTHGLSVCGYLFVEPGDRIITPDLFWGNYRLVFEKAYRAELDTFEMFKAGKFNVPGLRDKLLGSGDKKILLLNFPNNPAGYTPTDQEVSEIVQSVKEAAESGKNIVVMVDDAYFGLVYNEGIYRFSIFQELAGLHENVLAVKVDGPTKEDYVWGFRVGFLTFGVKGATRELYNALEAKSAGAIRGSISNVSHLGQSILLGAYGAPEYESQKQDKYETLRNRYLAVVDALSENSYSDHFVALPFNSGYFMCIELKQADAEETRKILLEKFDTGVISMGNKLRIAFSSVKCEDIPELFENIYRACSGK